mgnify:CR=1 FL=1
MAKFTFRRHKLAAAICTAALLMPVSVQAKRLTILYVPLDNRPVCSAYVKQTMEAANCKIILPPEKYIATTKKSGNPEAIWDWLEHKAPRPMPQLSAQTALFTAALSARAHTT